ncbi:MAG TPA: hypothetical protein VFB38_23370 [Chthonomonadaceae bacterium]|nr:hypothetical protein [Chthonomonadaceae bacterium]
MPDEANAGKSEKEANTQASASGPCARLGRALKAGLREAWDRLGLVIAISLTWALLWFPPLIPGRLPAPLPPVVRLALMALIAVLTLSAPMAGAFHVAHLAASHEEVAYGDFWRGAWRMYGPATRLGLIHLLVWSVGLTNLWFYLNIGHLIGSVAALFCLYVLLFWAMMSVYHFPLLAAQEAGVFDEPGRQARRGAWAAIRRAFFLTMGAPLYTAGVLAVVIAVTALLFATVALALILWLGVFSLVTTYPTRALLVQFGVLPPPPPEEPVPDEHFRIKD